MSNSQITTNITRAGIEEVLPYVPSNRGYIINGNKYYGNGNLHGSGRDVKMLTENNSVQIWLRRGFVENKLESDDTEWGIFTDKKQRRLVTSRAMRPCPTELKNSGMCHERFDPEHRKYFYHFAKYIKGALVHHENDGRVQCKYSRHGKWHCWEKNNGEHANVFFHGDDKPLVPVWNKC